MSARTSGSTRCASGENGPEARVFAFEAHPETADHAASHIALNHAENVELVRAGVSDRTGTLSLSYARGGDSGKSSFRRRSSAQLGASVEVPTVTIDEFAAARRLERLDLLKIDVEGHEPQVIAGALEAIRRFRPMICLEWTPQWCGDPGALGALSEAGYEFFSIEERLERRGAPLIGGGVAIAALRGQANLVALCSSAPEHVRALARLRRARTR